MASSDFRSQARNELERDSAVRQWFRARTENLRRSVTAYQILSHHGVRLRYEGTRAEQMSCPFHGKDVKPSARYHPADAKSSDHVWCYVCQEWWDSISLFRRYEVTESDAKFSRVLTLMERAFHVTPPDPPNPGDFDADVQQTEAERESLLSLLGICERRLVGAKRLFEMDAYLRVGTVLDRLYAQIDDKRITVDKAKGVARQILDKVAEKERAPSDDQLH